MGWSNWVRSLSALSLVLCLAGCDGSDAAAAGGSSGQGQPPRAGIRDGRPVGLFFMTRFWAFTGSLEKAVWYFAPDGTVYRDVETGFSAEDLAAHKNGKGTAKRAGDDLEVTWADGKTTRSGLEPDGDAFTWDMGIFVPVKPFADPKQVLGRYEGGESLSVGGSFAATSKALELRPDGTFTWEGVSSFKTTGDRTTVSGGGTSGPTTGRWELSGYSLTLTDTEGSARRRICFPYDDEETEVNPDRVFVGGTMMKRQ